MRYSRKMDFDGGGHPAISVGSLSAAVTQRYHASADRCFNNTACWADADNKHFVNCRKLRARSRPSSRAR